MIQQQNLKRPRSITSLHAIAALLFFIILPGHLTLQAQCPPVECMGFWEMEPNDMPEMATPIPPMDAICGMIEHPFDTDFFILDPSVECFDFFLQCDAHDTFVQIWGMSDMGFEILETFDTPGICEPEMGQWQWDPCNMPMDLCPPWIVQIAVSTMEPPAPASYQLDIIPTPPLALPGDCLPYPLYITGFPFSEDIALHEGFQDYGFEPSPDVWFEVYLPESGILEAWTCEGLTDFPTHLMVLGEDGIAVLAESFESGMCVEEAPDRSWVSHCLEAGLYYIMVEGRELASGNVTLNGDFTPSFQDPDLVVGEWGNDAEVWHQRFTDDDLKLQFFVDDACNEIIQVNFYQSLDGVNWEFLGTDLDGSSTREATVGYPSVAGDGWRYTLLPGQLMGVEPSPFWFRAEALLPTGAMIEASCQSFYDPWLGEEHLSTDLLEWNVTYSETLRVESFCDHMEWIQAVEWQVTPKDSVFLKGVPPIDQRPISDSYCAPTSAAACLKWFDVNGDPGVDGGLSNQALARRLGRLAKTDVGEPGTEPEDLVKALRAWLANHGNGYTVRGPMNFNWNRVRAELEQGQDVLIGITWPNGNGHRITMNSIHNEPNADSTITVDFMDPWTGEIEYGKLNPETGALTEYGDNPNYENRTAQMADNVIIVCPSQQVPGGGGGAIGGPLPWPPIDPWVILISEPGLHFLRVLYHDQQGKIIKKVVVVERRDCPDPLLDIVYDLAANEVILTWDAVEGADHYDIYSSTDPYFTTPEGTICGSSLDTHWNQELATEKLFYKVVTVCGAP